MRNSNLGGTTFTVSGTLTTSADTALVTFTGQSDDSNVSVPALTYDSVTFNNTGTTFNSAGSLTVEDTLTTTAGTFALNGNALTMTGATLANNATLQLQGGETITGLTMDTDSGTVSYDGTGTYTSLVAGNSYYHLTFNGSGGSWAADGAVTVAGDLTVSNGTYNASGQTTTVTGTATVSAGTYTAGTATQTFNGGLTVSGGTFTGSSGTVDINGALTLSSGTLTAPSSSGSFTVSGNFTHSGGTFTHNSGTVTLDGTAQTLSGSTTFYNFTKTEGADDAADEVLTFTAGTTQTITNTWTLDGRDDSDRINLVSSSPGTQWSVDPQGTRSISYVDVQDSNNVNGTVIAPSNSTDSGNNTNWFTPVSAGRHRPNAYPEERQDDDPVAQPAPPAAPISMTTGKLVGHVGRDQQKREERSRQARRVREAIIALVRREQAALQKPVSPSVFVSLQRKIRGLRITARLPQEERQLKVTVPTGREIVFRDVPVRAWFAPYVLFVATEGIATGYGSPEGERTEDWNPAAQCTYAELAKMVVVAAKKPVEERESLPRNRTAQGDWSARYVAAAEALGLSVFTPSITVQHPVSRGEAVQTVLEALGIPIAPQAAVGMLQFTDLPEDDAYARAIATATIYGLLEGDTDSSGKALGTIRPGDAIRRAEVAKILALALTLLKQ